MYVRYVCALLSTSICIPEIIDSNNNNGRYNIAGITLVLQHECVL